MGCCKRKKILGFISRPHQFELIGVGVFMPFVSDDYTTEEKCRYCGLVRRNHFVSAEYLMINYLKFQDLIK